MVKNNLPKLRPLPRGEDPAGSEQRVTGGIQKVPLRTETKPMQNAAFQIMRCGLVTQFLYQHLMKNLESGRSVNKRAPGFGHYPCTYRERITILRLSFMQPKDWLDAAIKVEQLPDRDLRFARIISPGCDGICDPTIELE